MIRFVACKWAVDSSRTGEILKCPFQVPRLYFTAYPWINLNILEYIMIKKQNRKSMMKTIEDGQTNLFAVGSIVNQAKIMGQRNLHSFFHHPLPLCRKKRAPLGKLPVSSQPLPRQLHARCQTSRSDVRMHRKRNDSKIGSFIQSLIHPF